MACRRSRRCAGSLDRLLNEGTLAVGLAVDVSPVPRRPGSLQRGVLPDKIGARSRDAAEDQRSIPLASTPFGVAVRIRARLRSEVGTLRLVAPVFSPDTVPSTRGHDPRPDPGDHQRRRARPGHQRVSQRRSKPIAINEATLNGLLGKVVTEMGASHVGASVIHGEELGLYRELARSTPLRSARAGPLAVTTPTPDGRNWASGASPARRRSCGAWSGPGDPGPDYEDQAAKARIVWTGELFLAEATGASCGLTTVSENALELAPN